LYLRYHGKGMWFCALSKFGNRTHNCVTRFGSTAGNTDTVAKPIGHHMVYDAAVSAGVPWCLINLYVVSIMKLNPSWYSEVGGVCRKEQYKMEDKAVTEVGHRLEEFIQDLGAEPSVTAPIISDGMWHDFVANLPACDGRARGLTSHMPHTTLARL
jgi:acyl-CoA oxidase